MVAVLWVWHSVQRLGDCLHLCVEDRLDIAITAIAARRKKSLKDVNSYIPIIFFFQSCLGTGAGPIPEIRTELFFSTCLPIVKLCTLVSDACHHGDTKAVQHYSLCLPREAFDVLN